VAGRFVVARNPEPDSTLPYLISLPLGAERLVLKAREVWPRTAKVYCHRAEEWPEVPDVIEDVEVRSCVRRGPAVDLVLARARENRSQLVFARLKNGREAIFWQTPKTTRRARPGVRVPTRRASGWPVLPVVIDTRERYPYRFVRQQVSLERRALHAGDYGVELDGRLVAAVERKTVADLAHVLVDGSIGYLLADLSSLPRAAVVVEDRYADLYKLEHVKEGFVPDLLARVQVRWPSVPIVFCETRPLAEQWTYRFLGAALSELTAVRDNGDDGESAGWPRPGDDRVEEGRGSTGQGAG
jgi:hypothetical protein